MVLYIIMTVVFVIGVLYGILSNKDTKDVVLNSEQTVVMNKLVLTSFIKNCRDFSWVCVFSMSAIGTPFIIYLTYMKGFSSGTALYFAVLSAKCGALKAIFLCLPYLALSIASFVILSKFGINLSLEIAKCVFFAKHKTVFQTTIRRFFFALLSAFILSILSGAAESLINQIFL